MIKINTQLTSKNGNVIESGSILNFKTSFGNDDSSVYFNMRLYRNEDDIKENKGNISCIEIPKMGITLDEIKKEDFNKLTPVACEKRLQQEIEKIIVSFYQKQLEGINLIKTNLDKVYEERKNKPENEGKMTKKDYDAAVKSFNESYSTKKIQLETIIKELKSISITEII